MNKQNPKSFNEVDEDAMALERIANTALSLAPKTPEPVIKGTRVPASPKPTVD